MAKKLDLKGYTGLVSNATGQAKPADAKIPLSLIDTVAQVRTVFANLQDLADEFMQIDEETGLPFGIQQPVILLAKPDGRYRLIAGERRCRAAPLAGLDEVPALIKRDLSEKQIRHIQVSENMNRENLTAYDQALGVAEDVENFGFKEAQTIWNRSEGWVSKRVAVQKYAAPIRALLQEGHCDDLEILHSLNQLYAASVEEFQHMEKRLKGGLPLSREEARNKVQSVKQWQKNQAALKTRRDVVEKVGPAAGPEQAEDNDQDSGGSTASDGAGSADAVAAGSDVSSPVPAKTAAKQTAKPTAKEAAAHAAQAAQARLEKHFRGLLNEAFDSGVANQDLVSGLKADMLELGCDMNQTDWVLWSSFLSVTLPLMEVLGKDLALAYVKRMQVDFKKRSPMEIWQDLHPVKAGADADDVDAEREEIAVMPEGWRF